MKNSETKAIIIGADHINTLAAIRCLGRQKINFKVLIHDEKLKTELMVSYSKYAKNLYVVKNKEEDIINWLIYNKGNEKAVILPCSDFAEYTIDNNYEKLKENYFVPGFKNNPGLVCKLMDKYEQKMWAYKNNILMANTFVIDTSKKIELRNIPFPCIVKPCISAFGSKSDIKVCNDMEELNSTIDYYLEKSYNRILIQEFLHKEFEICSLGCILENNVNYGNSISKIREYPVTGGSTSFGKFGVDSSYLEQVNSVINKLIQSGYIGLYDIEFLVVEGKVYLNEINFRNSGNCYALTGAGVEAPYLLYLNCINKSLLNSLEIKNRDIYFIEDLSSLASLKKKEIGIFRFISEFFKAKAHSIFLLTDLKVIKFYIKKVKNKYKKNKRLLNR